MIEARPATPDRETRRELAKLTANYVNALAVAVLAVGGLAPPVAAFSGTGTFGSLLWVLVLSFGAFLVSLVAHLGARYLLRREFR